MPELPEVETIARGLRPQITGRTVLQAELRWQRTLATPSPITFKRIIQGQQILEVGRRAKFLVIRLSTQWLLVHLRMTGDLLLKKDPQPEKHDRLRLRLTSGGSEAEEAGSECFLVFNDARKFGRVWLTPDPQAVLGRLGPEPFADDFTAEWL